MQSLAPSEFFEGIKFNYSFYTTGDTKVTLEYVNNNFLKCTGYAYSRAISTSFNGIIYALGGIETTDIIASGTISANLFQGSGTELTNLNASNISDGTLTVSRGGTGLSTLASGQLLIGNDIGNIVQTSNLIWDIPNNNLGIGKNPAQKLDVNGTIAATLFSGSGASLTGLTEGQIPVLTAAKIPELPQTRIKDLETTLSTINEVINAIALGTGIENLDAAKLTGTINNARLPTDISVNSFTGDGASITAINASNIATGTINNARLPTDISVNSFTGDGASITAINASNIATGTINNDRIALTTTKVFQHFDDKTFKIIDDKINLTPDVGTYTFNILAYDRVFDNGLVYLQSGKFTCSYEDRTGVYVLRTTQTIPNKLILDYKVGDKLVFKNSAKKTWDYLYDTTGIPPVQVQKWGKLTVFKIANATNWTGQGEEVYMTKIFEWRSATETVIDYTKSEASFPWGTTMTLTMEAGFRYFIIKYQWNVNDNYYVTPASEDSQMNITNNGGQGFKMITSYLGTSSYIPQTPSVVEVMSETKAGVAFRGTRMSISEDGALSADIPTTTELLTSMNASHFTNNTQTGKIDINTNLAELKGPKGDTGKGWTGATYSGTTGIVTFASGDALGFNTGDLRGGKGDTGKGWTGATYSGTTGIVTFASGDALGFNTGDIRGGKGDNGTNGKGWTGATYSATTGKVSFASNDGTPFVFDTGDLRGGKGDKGDNGTNGKGWTGATYNSTTGKVSFASTDGTPYVFDTGDLRGGAGTNGKGWTGATYNSTTGKVSFTSTDAGFAFDTGDLRGASGATITPTQLSALMNTTDHFTLNGTTNKIDFKTTYKIPTAGTADAVVWSGITSVPSTWTDTQIPTLAISKVSGLQGALDAKQATINNTAGQLIIGNGNGTTTTNTGLTFSGSTLTANNLTISTNLVVNASAGIVGTSQFTGNVGIGTTSHATYKVDVNGTLNATNILIGGNPISGSSKWTTATDTTRIYYNTGNVGIGTIDPQTKLHIRDDTTNTTALTIQNNSTPTLSTEIKQYPETPSTNANSWTDNGLNVVCKTSDAILATAYDVFYLFNNLIANPDHYHSTQLFNSASPYNYTGSTSFKGANGLVIYIDLGQSIVPRSMRIAPRDNSVYALNFIGAMPGRFKIYASNDSAAWTNNTHSSWTELHSQTTSLTYNYNQFTNFGDFSTITTLYRYYTLVVYNLAGSYGYLTFSEWDIFGTYYLNPSSSSTIELLRGTTIDANHDWKLGNYSGDFKIKKSVNNVDTDVLIIYKNQLNGRDIFYLPDGDLNVDGTTYTTALSVTGNISGGGFLQGSGGGGAFRIGRPDSWVRLQNTAETTHLDFAAGQLFSHSTITSQNLNNAQVLTIGGINDGGNISKLRVYASDGNSCSAIFKHPNDTQGIGIKYDGLLALGTPNQGIYLTTRGSGSFVVNNTAGDTNLQFITSINGNYGEVVGDWYVSGYGHEIYSGFRAVSTTDTDHLVVQRNYGENEINSNWIKVGYGSFTAFHRCYTDDELYNGETDEDIDIFKNKYVGCVVIATGKIKTDFTRKIPNEVEVEVEVESEPIHRPPKKEIDEWYSEIDKDGITIEDAVPVVRLSRQSKDKRVFGVFGGIRSTNNKDRLIVNSVGEGGITVANTNGNIENGDYIQSSDILGYGEKQDDDLLHNYTVAKATMDCIFELDSPYYQCYEIENGVRVAFIACSYHCG